MPRGGLAKAWQAATSFSHLELCHLLFQIDNELLDPGIICLIVAELLLIVKCRKGCLCGLK